jgi:uncharacterized protein
MNVLDHFSIPYQGLKNGLHSLHFNVEKGFFEAFECTIVKTGVFDVEMELDKRPDMAIADFHCKGQITLPCDRCLLDFDMPLEVDFKLHIKYGQPSNEDDEVLFIDPETSHINVAQHIYEWVCISLPMVRTHESMDQCDPEIIEKLTKSDEAESGNPLWESLRSFKAEE